MRLNSMLSQHGRVRIRSGNHARHQEGQVSAQGCVCSHNLRCNCPKALEIFLQICSSNALRQTPHIKGFMGGIQLAGLAIHHGSESNLEAGTVHIVQYEGPKALSVLHEQAWQSHGDAIAELVPQLCLLQQCKANPASR